MVAYTTTYNLKKPTVADDEDVWGGYLNDSMDLIDDVLDGTTPVTGIDINSGTLDNVVIGGTTANTGTFTVLSATTSLGVTGNITVSGTVDGRDVAADGTKLDGIESNATADQTKADIDALGIAASTAATLATARNIALSGDVSGSASFNGSANISITATVADDSHNHVISNVDGLQTALDGKLSTSGKAADSNLLDGIDSGSFLRSDANDSYSGILTGGELAQGQHPIHTGYYGIWNTQAYGANSQNYMIINAGTDTYITGNDVVYIRGGDNSSVNEVKVTTSGTTIGGNTVWHAGNDGSGSGLDADTLDGVQGSSYLRSDTTDTMSGRLEMGNVLDMNNYDIYGVDQLFHHGDTNTYMQFHASDQWRVVTGGAERLEVNNTRTFIDRLYVDAGVVEDYEGLSGTSVTCNVNNGGAFGLTMTGNTTFTFTAPWSTADSVGFVLQLTGNGSTVTWPTSVDWAGGTAPDAPASGETDIYVFWTRNGGTTWYGVQSIDAAA